MIIHLFLSITILYYYLDHNLRYFTTKVYNYYMNIHIWRFLWIIILDLHIAIGST